MTKQWHNPKIPQRPFTRYNPSLKQNISSVYRPWFVLACLLCVLIGIAIVALSVVMKVTDGDMKDELFHMWVGVPLLVFGIVAIVPFITKSKLFTTFVLILSLIVMVVCATGAVVTGLRYWMDHWQQVKNDFDDGKCAMKNGKCICSSVETAMPSSLDDCDDLELMTNLVISEIALCAAGFLASIFTTFLSFMAICCGPWMYVEWYEEEHDPDFSGGDNVQQIGARPKNGTINAAYGGYN